MKTTFPGFPKEGIAFLRALKKNNDREWFTPRKAEFEATVKQPMIELVRAIHREMMRFAPQYVGEPAKCVYRIYRDTRFSKDKTPYKTFASALLLRNGFDKHSGSAGIYFSVSPSEIEVAGGVYMPDRDVLLRLQNNLKSRLLQAQHRERALRAVESMLMLAPDLAELWGEAAMLHRQLGNLRAAGAALEQYVVRAPDGTARHQAAAMLQQLRTQLN